MKRRAALWLARRLERLAFLLDRHTAPKYDPTDPAWKWSDVTDEEWTDFIRLGGRETDR
jgi:hypothetical protein